MLPRSKSGLLRRFAPRNDGAPPRSRGAIGPSFAKTGSPLLTIEGAGNAGRSMRPQPRVRNKKAHEHSHHGHTGNHPAFPAQWFYGLLRALPGDQACLTPSPARLLADLTPASGRQNDTTWPYASALFVNCAAAPTASRPASVTIASRPSVGRDGRGYIADLGPLAREISEIQKHGNPARDFSCVGRSWGDAHRS